MLADSVLGRLYGYWLHSLIFRFLRAIYRPFKNAFPHSVIIRFLGRPSRVEKYYAASAVGRFIDWLWKWLLRILGAIVRFFARLAETSVIVRLVRGSYICRFDFLLPAFIFVMFCAPHNVWSNSYAVLAVFGLFGIYLLLAAVGKREAPSPRTLGLPFLLFVMACFISLIFTTDMADSIRILMFFIAAFMLLYMVSAELSTVGRLRSLMRWLYAAVMVTAAYAVVQRIMGVEVNASLTDLALNEGVPGRVYSTLDNSNNYAEFLVLFTPLCAAWAINLKDVRARFVFSCALALPMLALIMTYSRSGWLSFMLAVLVFVYYTDKRLIPVGFVACLLLIPFCRTASLRASSPSSTARTALPATASSSGGAYCCSCATTVSPASASGHTPLTTSIPPTLSPRKPRSSRTRRCSTSTCSLSWARWASWLSCGICSGR